MTGESITDTGSPHSNYSTTDPMCEIAHLRGELSASDKLELLCPVTPTRTKANMAANETDELHLSL